jgi:hypothetical protein
MLDNRTVAKPTKRNKMFESQHCVLFGIMTIIIIIQ